MHIVAAHVPYGGHGSFAVGGRDLAGKGWFHVVRKRARSLSAVDGVDPDPQRPINIDRHAPDTDVDPCTAASRRNNDVVVVGKGPVAHTDVVLASCSNLANA